MDPIKESFQKVKGDIYSLKNELEDIKKELNEIQTSILTLIKTTSNQNFSQNSSQFNQLNPFPQIRQTDRPTDRHFDRQTNRDPDTSTDQQTNRQTQNPADISNYYQNSTHSPAQNLQNSTIRHINQTEGSLSTHNSTDISPFNRLKGQNIPFSTGNRGVSTDRQTDQQTDTSTGNRGVISSQDFRENTQKPNLSSVSSNFIHLPIPQSK